MPSDLSDFSLYGGMYRHVNLVYVPAVSLETVHVQTELPSPKGSAKIAILATLYNPMGAADSLEVSVE
jgi:beta-galactosidase